jgi:hypothetical protein
MTRIGNGHYSRSRRAGLALSLGLAIVTTAILANTRRARPNRSPFMPCTVNNQLINHKSHIKTYSIT